MVGSLPYILIFLLIGCAGSDERWRTEYREAFRDKNFELAHELLEKGPYHEDDKSRLLYRMEKASLYFHQGDCEKAGHEFHQAKEESTRLRTISLSRKMGAFFTGDQNDDFRGSLFEQSYVYFYSALSHYQCHLKSGQRQELFRARADLLAWNQFFETLQRDYPFKTLYFNDVFAKFFAALVHEQIGSSQDRQIALQLYKDAYQISQVVPLQYQDYSAEADQFVAKIYDVLKDDGKYEQIDASVMGNQRLQDLQNKILYQRFMLAARIRPRELREDRKLFEQLSIEQQKQIREQKNSSLKVIIAENLLPPKQAKKIDLSLRAAFDENASGKQAALSAIGYVAMSAFAYNVLNIRPAMHQGVYVSSHGASYYGVNDFVTVAASEAGLGFEVFAWPNKISPGVGELAVYDEQAELVQTSPTVLVSALGSIAHRSAEENSTQRVLSQGTKFVLKHVIAMASAYTLYKTMSNSESSQAFAGVAALATYVSATRLLESAHRADTRYWSTLPHNLWYADLDLSPGEYKLYLSKDKQKNFLSNVTITDQSEILYWRH